MTTGPGGARGVAAAGAAAGPPAFDLLIRGGLLVDGTGAPARRADVGIAGDRIVAVGDLSAVDPAGAAEVVSAEGLCVMPGFIDIHGHSDGSVLVDGALASLLHQGFTTQLSGNCGDSAAPVTTLSREPLEIWLGEYGLQATWPTFGAYLDDVASRPLGINVAFLAGHNTLRAAVMGSSQEPPDAAEAAAMARWLEEALDAGAFGLSTGLIYPPGIHARPDEVAALVRVAARRGGLYATHMRNECAGLFDAIAEALEATRAAGAGARLQVSHLKAADATVRGRAPEAVAMLERARESGIDAAADQYPYTAAATSLATILPPWLLGLEVDVTVDALRDAAVRRRIREEIAHGIPGWENTVADPGWEGIALSDSATHPEWTGRAFDDLADEAGRDPLDLACDLLADDRLASGVTIHCMDEEDVEAILAVPWIAVCTDAAGIRADHPVLGTGVPHPRAYGSAPRVLGRYVRDRAAVPLEVAVAKLTSVPAARMGLAGRGIVREGAAADLVVADLAAVADRATYDRPAAYPAGIGMVVVNGAVAVRDGVETAARAGRLLRRD